ncbi:MAG: SymE family type I addiction module toxin, partial [Pedobacter sp.]|nr:SymE family type I addiction module toxin [Pedobacter sp.]
RLSSRRTKANAFPQNFNALIPETTPAKTCTCGAPLPPQKPKLPKGQRRLKVCPHQIVRERAHVITESKFDYVPQIRLIGQWLRTTGFEPGQFVIVSAKKGKLTIKLDQI